MPLRLIYCQTIRFIRELLTWGLDQLLIKKKILLEVNIFNFNKKIYGKRIRVEFVKFIRGEKKFKNINNLKKQIKLDIKKAKKIN